jgi:hypothetical protein
MFTRESILEGIIAHQFNKAFVNINEVDKKHFENLVKKHSHWSNRRIAEKYYEITGLFIWPRTSQLFDSI